jgi:hypothetical protein
MSEPTDAKLREARFFYLKLAREAGNPVPNEPEAFLFYLSAFLSAGESVKGLVSHEGFVPSEWEPKEERDIFYFFNEQRRLVVHQGTAKAEFDLEYVPVSTLPRERSHPAFGHHWFGPPGTEEPAIGRRTYFFKIDGKEVSVLECCKQHLELLEKLVQLFS